MKKSFSLIEVIIFVSILSIILVSAASIVTVSLQQNKLLINKLKARHYAYQLLEWIKNQKDLDWNSFITLGTNKIYCFETEGLAWGPSVSSGSSCPLLLGMYRRYAAFKKSGSDGSTQIDVVINISWSELGNTYAVPLHVIFSQWE